jgi:hypothetical protein
MADGVGRGLKSCLQKGASSNESRSRSKSFCWRTNVQNDTRTFLIIFVAALFILRYKFALLLIGVLAWKVVLAMLLIPVVMALATWRERHHTRGFDR